jgi:3-deoxy-D-manno-octulosonic-acid transferase
MSFIYDLFFLIYALLYIPYLWIKRKWHDRFWERLGFFSDETKGSFSSLRDPIWLHAVSVGETGAVVPLAEVLQREYPDRDLVVTTVTTTGQSLAISKMPSGTMILYAPLDASWVVNKYIRLIKPCLYIAAETEIWPNLYLALHKHGVPVIQVNGRISDKAFSRYYRFKSLLRPVLDCVTSFGVQTETDLQRLTQIGAQKDKIEITGNVKFDCAACVSDIRPEAFGFDAKDKIIVAGSTHPGEEVLILNNYGELRKKENTVRLIIAPRHVERAEDIAALVRSYGWKPVLYSKERGEIDANEVLIIDKIGHLLQSYSIASLVFIGKTFRVGGGQNMIEPAACGKATIVGPMTGNFRDVMRLLLQEKGILQLEDESLLLPKMQELLNDEKMRFKMGEAARNCVLKYCGATEKTVNMIKRILN